MEFRITFYRTASDETPMLEFLESMRLKNATLHKLIVAGIAKLRIRDNHGRPLTARIEGSSGMIELRVGHADIARVFFFFRPNSEIVCTHGYVKKAQRLDPSELARAERYKTDWEQRFP